MDVEQDKIIAKGERAKQLLDSELFLSTMAEIQSEMFANFLATSGDEGEARDTYWALSNACIEIERKLRTHVTNAEVERRAQQEEKQAQGGKIPWT